jgi:TolB-like protein/DNA-binding SARP family transcriptional activator
MASLRLALLGGFQAFTAGQEIDVPGRKERALLAFLAIPAGEPRSRDKVAGLLWSDRSDSQARDSLKQAVFKVRNSLDGVQPSPLRADREFLSLERAAVSVDVAEFEQLIGEGTTERLARAAALYRGDLLDGLDVRDAAFDEWLLMERERLRDLAREALAMLLAQYLAGGARDEAAAVARRLLALDPLREIAHRALMQIYTAQGQTALALKQYQLCRDTLQCELGVRPEAETEQLYRSIQAVRTAPHQQRAAGPLVVASPRPGTLSPVQGPAASTADVKPSIAVLPFVNLSGDPEQEYFADGMVEEIITALSRMRSLVVIARNSSFFYKGRSINVKQVGLELGVRYVLEGSVRKAANRLRITGQLIDAETGAHLWADRFDGNMEDIFDLQDQVTARVVGAIAPKLDEAEIERTRSKPTESLDAYDCFLRGMAGLHKFSREGNDEALAHFYRAIELDPNYAAAHGMAARTYVQRNACGWVSDHPHALAEAGRLARRAVELGHDDAVALATGGFALADLVGDIEDGDAFIEQALELNPNLAWAWLYSGWVKAATGDADRAIERIACAKRLSPHDPQDISIQNAMAFAHFIAGRYGESLACAQAAVRVRPNLQVVNCLAAASAALAGQPAEARKAMERLLRLNPSLRVADTLVSRRIRRPEDIARWTDGLRQAGLPE